MIPFRQKARLYYVLSKPGIIYANVLTAVAGYLFASEFKINVVTLAGLVGGLTLVIAGACAFNNYLDRNIDAHMKRTKKRGLVTGDLTTRQALGYATITSLVGIGLLVLTQNTVTTLLAGIAFIDYVVLYGWSKRKSVHGTLVGTISGSIPLVAGYTAVTGVIDATAALLFVLMAAWQMGHFYGIALYRRTDYAAAGIPVMPVARGELTTQKQTLVYIGLFVATSLVFTMRGDIGAIWGWLLTGLGVVWLIRSLQSYGKLDATHWGKQVFLFSLTVMLGLSVFLAVGRLIFY